VEINTTVREESGARSPSPKSPVSPNPWGNKLNVPKKEEPKKEEPKSPGGGLAKTTPTPQAKTPVAEVKSSGPRPGETQEEMIRREAAERREQRAKQLKEDEQRKKETAAKEAAEKEQAERKKALQAKFAKLGASSGGK